MTRWELLVDLEVMRERNWVGPSYFWSHNHRLCPTLGTLLIGAPLQTEKSIPCPAILIRRQYTNQAYV